MNTSSDTLYDYILRLFMTVPDYRSHRTRIYPLPMLLFCALGAFICGWDSFHSMSIFASTHRDLIFQLFNVRECPSHDTFARLFARMDKKAFAVCLQKLSEKLGELLAGGVIAIDGKTCRRARSATQRAAHIVSAWSPSAKMTLGLVAVDEKSNEIPAVPELIKLLGSTVSGSIVTADALNTQKATVEVIRKNNGDYILPVKENQPGLLEAIKLFLDKLADDENAGFISIDKGHGRLETRKCWQTDNIDWLPSCYKWAGLKSLCVIDRQAEDLITKKQSFTRRYFISSLSLNPQQVAESVRSHWGVENSCHWVLDVIFNEDQNRSRTGDAAVNLRTLRSFAINLLSKAQKAQKKQDTKPNMMHRASADCKYLCSILGLSYQENLEGQC